jgi:uncharacterized protein (DUF2141 family)
VSDEPLAPVPAGTGTLILEITGLRDTAGQIHASIFKSEDGFPRDTTAVFASATLDLTAKEGVVLRFTNLEFGYYAIAVLHDKNGNGTMDTGLLGVPSEGFGFSNNPRIGFGAPSFESCRFRFDRKEVVLPIEILHF